ncbi:hypothetical protein SAPIO_CDS5273 [Scedosporium apiospermum]|uniref:Uncharacterized protein n=1 Tax=Pseudallescheria apiosperma TaxID=563466 RepID=A0A084G684_PSEDA|nr:uncharacterized protein SAPIO_CDS5273 [Scedosporium apiospermum]KEZ42846.1 hypothetical protein SAPIO_CDS5273 [Scedosporium apiospermum]
MKLLIPISALAALSGIVQAHCTGCPPELPHPTVTDDSLKSEGKGNQNAGPYQPVEDDDSIKSEGKEHQDAGPYQPVADDDAETSHDEDHYLLIRSDRFQPWVDGVFAACAEHQRSALTCSYRDISRNKDILDCACALDFECTNDGSDSRVVRKANPRIKEDFLDCMSLCSCSSGKDIGKSEAHRPRQIVPEPIPFPRPAPPAHDGPHGHHTRVPFPNISGSPMGHGPVNSGTSDCPDEMTQRYSVPRPTPIPESTVMLSVTTEDETASATSSSPTEDSYPDLPTEIGHDWPTSAFDPVPISLRTRLPFGPGADKDVPIPSEGPAKATARGHIHKPCGHTTIYTTVLRTVSSNHPNGKASDSSTTFTPHPTRHSFTTIYSKDKPDPKPTPAAPKPAINPWAKVTCLAETEGVCEDEFACLADGTGLVLRDDSWIHNSATGLEVATRYCKLACFCDNEPNQPIIYTSMVGDVTLTASPESESGRPFFSGRIPFSGDHHH